MQSIRDRISSVEFGVAIKSGMRLTYDQYDGIRHLLSFEYNEAARKYQPRVIDPRSGKMLESKL